MKEETKTKKCIICGKRFRLHDWQIGIERFINIRCLSVIAYMIDKKRFAPTDYRLTPREAKILAMRFGYKNKKWQSKCSTLEEVGRKFGVTRERIRQMEARAIEKVRQILKIL